MMSYKIKDGKIDELMTAGDGKNLLEEIGVLIHCLYRGLAKCDEEVAEVFKRKLQLFVSRPESGIWEKDDVECISIVQRKKRGSKQ